MPSIYCGVEAPGINIWKTVTDEVVAGLLSELGLTDVFADAVYIMSSFMASSQYNDSQGRPTLVKNRCDVDVSYVMDKAQVPWPIESPYTTSAYGMRASSKGHYSPILYDEKAGVLVEQQTIPAALEMNFVLTFANFDIATKAFDTIQSRYKGSLIQTPFDLAFSYPVSMDLYTFLASIYQAKADYQNKTFLNYLSDMQTTQISFDVRKSQLTDPKADTELMVRCQQLNCLGQLTMEQKEPDGARTNDLPDGFSLSFTFVIQFGRPVTIAAHTPVSIDNTLLPPNLFRGITAQSHWSPGVTGVYSDLMCNEWMKRGYDNYKNSGQIVRLPIYDDWLTVDKQYQFYQYRPLLVAHFTLDGPETILDLTNLGSIQLHPVVQSIMKETGNQIFRYGGLFTLGVYAGNLRLGPEIVSIDDNLQLTIQSVRPDKVYHVVLSETTNLQKTDPVWDPLLLKYRYFFPMTIERNLQSLIAKKYFSVETDHSFLMLIRKLGLTSQLKAILNALVALGEDTNEIYSYTQNPIQLADYLANTQSARQNYTLPTGTDPVSVIIQQFYQGPASVEGRSLLTAFLEQCLANNLVTLDTLPSQYLVPNPSIYPYSQTNGGYYAFNTPFRVLNTVFDLQHHT